MSRRIIVVYNSRDAAMPNPQARLLRTQLAEVEAEMQRTSAHDHKVLSNERRLLKRKLGALDKDGVGSFEEQAYGEGWHSESNTNPYTEASHRAAWEKGRAAGRQKRKLNTNAHRGEVRGKRFEQPKVKVSADSKYSLITQEGMPGGPQVFYVNTKTSEIGPFKSRAAAERYVDEHPKLKPPSAGRDYKSEKGFVAKLIDVQTGATLARSEPHISNGLGLKKWMQEEAEKLIKRGKRVKAEVAVVFFDPNMA